MIQHLFNVNSSVAYNPTNMDIPFGLYGGNNIAVNKGKTISPKIVDDFVNDIFGTSMHLKRIKSLSNAILGVVESLSLAIHMIGQGLAQAKEYNKKHCVKQVDRLLSNQKLDVWECFSDWVPFIIGEKKEAYIAMDWTEFDSDDHSTIMLSMITVMAKSPP